MSWVSLQMIFLGSLLIFHHQTSSSSGAAAGSSGCISEEAIHNRTLKRWRTYWGELEVSDKILQLQGARTCAQTAKEIHGDLSRRSVSPWRYRLDRDDNRFPRTIPIAECLCKGCIINQREELSFNSVPVLAPMVVMRKTRCLSEPNKYEVKKDFIKVPVACTCVVPKYTE